MVSPVSPVDPSAIHLRVSKSQGLCGWLQYICGKSVPVTTDHGRIFYNKKSLAKKIADAAQFTCPPKSTLKLATLVYEVLNPVKGLPLQIEQVDALFADVAKLFSEEPGTMATLSKKLKQRKTAHLETLTFNPETMRSVLKVGDIFFKKNPANSDKIVVKAQKIFSNMNSAKLRDRESFKYSHMAIYLGNGEIAEAACAVDGGIQLRRVTLSDPRFALHQEEGEKYLVARATDSGLAAAAAEIARSIVVPASPLSEQQKNNHPHKYSYSDVAFSLLHSCTFGHFAKQRFFKEYIDIKSNDYPRSFMNHKNFYCSNFVSYCFQTAESQRTVPQIISERNIPPKVHTTFFKAIFRGLWARYQAGKHQRQLNRAVQMRFDAKWMTPQDFRNFIVGHPSLFTDKYLIKN